MLEKLKPTKIYQSDQGNPYYFTHDYHLVILGIELRDIKGRDLTYLDFIYHNYKEDYVNSLGFILDFLSKFAKPEHKQTLGELTPKQLRDVISVYVKKVIRQPPSRDIWLQNVYYLNGESYCNLSSYEDIPITEMLQMISVHMDRIEQEKEAMKKNK